MMSVLPTLLQPPPTAEELALKEQITQALTSQGVLARLKAELRAAVFEVMHEREGFAKTTDSITPKLSDFPFEIRTTALALIAECLHFFQWEHALRVLLAEADAEDEQHDSAQLAKKLGLASNHSSGDKPTLFQLIEYSLLGDEKSVRSVKPVAAIKHNQFAFEEESGNVSRSGSGAAPKAQLWEQEDDLQSPPVESETMEIETKGKEDKDEGKVEEAESSVEIEESMVEEVPSGSDLEESNFTNYEDESQDYRTQVSIQPTVDSTRQQDKLLDEKDQEESHGKDGHESDAEDVVSLAAPPPAPAKLPSLPPLGNTLHDEEAERLKKLDAALQAMEAEDDTGTLQQLKKSLQMELQEQDSLLISGGLGNAEEDSDADADPETSKSRDEEGDDDGYGSSDFEEEEIAR
ncbi:unnamed protein product [Phytophthora fragariaefolia]|uniref:Unnamed protein product n=1 Tax=Phytophthora fragariaefolia TaxID=1490495 RepID=A0A9W6X918_9STRA|nr:unnamed protein product [Phytophthora fragariaefolia]